jgi:hypothetical protein
MAKQIAGIAQEKYGRHLSIAERDPEQPAGARRIFDWNLSSPWPYDTAGERLRPGGGAVRSRPSRDAGVRAGPVVECRFGGQRTSSELGDDSATGIGGVIASRTPWLLLVCMFWDGQQGGVVPLPRRGHLRTPPATRQGRYPAVFRGNWSQTTGALAWMWRRPS